MKNYRFYAEMPEEQKSKSASKKYDAFTRGHLRHLALWGKHNNCIAIPLDDKGQPLWCSGVPRMDAYVTNTQRPNDYVVGSTVDRGYLRIRCVRIDADLARRLHPNLFNYLERT